jgi:hypothetical protein
MKRTRLLSIAAISGAALGAGYLVARPNATATGPADVSPTAKPAAAVSLDPAPPRQTTQDAAMPGTAQLVARAKDPSGGPDWVVRTWLHAPDRFERRLGSSAPRRCVQLGRLVDGRVAWGEPGSSRLKALPLAYSATTRCVAPGEPFRGLVQIGGELDGRPASPTSRVRAMVVWGLAPAGAVRARIAGANLAGPVDVRGGGAFLRVAAATAPPTDVRLVTTAADGRSWTVPSAEGSDGRLDAAVQREMLRGLSRAARAEMRRNFERARAIEARTTRTALATAFAPVAKFSGDRLGSVQAIYAQRGAGGRPCVTEAIDTAGGLPVRGIGLGQSGLVTTPELTCRFVTRRADRAPVSLGGGGSRGVDPDYANVRAADRAQLRERRRPPVSAGMVIAAPRGTRYLEVRSPVGVTTVRVSWARVTVVQWDGQPEVLDALSPRYRKVKGITTRFGGQGIWVQARDARGRPIGPQTRLR